MVRPIDPLPIPETYPPTKTPIKYPPSLRPIGPRRARNIRPIEAFPDYPKVEPANVAENTEEAVYRAWEAIYQGTYPEFLAWRWLKKHHYEPDVDFAYQASKNGGRHMPGGAVVDFDIMSLNIAWRIQGERFHIGNPETEARDVMQKLSLEAIGYHVVDVFAQDLLERIDYVLGRAIQGEQIRFLQV